MTDRKKALVDAIAAAGGLRSIRLGGTVYVYAGIDAKRMEAKLVKTAIRTGQTLERNGAQEWWEWEPDYDSDKHGSACYTWNPDGNRVRATLFHNVKDKNGSFSKSPVRKGWRSFIEE